MTHLAPALHRPFWSAASLGSALFVAGFEFEYVLPAFFGSARSALRSSSTQVGLRSAPEMGAVGVSSLMIGLTLDRIAWAKLPPLCAAIRGVGNVLGSVDKMSVP